MLTWKGGFMKLLGRSQEPGLMQSKYHNWKLIWISKGNQSHANWNQQEYGGREVW